LSGDQSISTQLIPKQPSANPSTTTAWDPIPHASWELGCLIGAVVSMFIVAGIFAIFVMESLLLLMQRRRHCCQARIITLVARCQADIVALIVMALLPSMCRRFCHCSCHDGVVVVVHAQSSPPLSS
jgi:hypothetical protein